MIQPAAMSDLQVLARTLWAEARSQGSTGMQAVANVIVNRARQPAWWGVTIREVCLKPWQFSCWSQNDPQYAAIRADRITGAVADMAAGIAHSAFSGNLPDLTRGSDHYCTKAVAGRTAWAKGRTPTAAIGDHLFYKVGPRG